MQNLKDFFDGLSYEVARLSMGDSYGILNGVIQDTEIPEKYSTVLDLAKGLVGALGGVGDEDSNDLMTQIQTYCTDKEDALGNRRSIKNREVNIIINQYNGTLDVIMPVKEDDLELFVNNYASTISKNAPLTIKAMKQIGIEISKNSDDRDLLLCEQLASECFDSEDYKEGRKAFMEKRSADFKGI